MLQTMTTLKRHVPNVTLERIAIFEFGAFETGWLAGQEIQIIFGKDVSAKLLTRYISTLVGMLMIDELGWCESHGN